MDCLFCKIVSGQINSHIVYEDDDILAFDDIAPKAPIHQLIIPKKHIATLNDLEQSDQALVGKMLLVATQLAKQYNIADAGYRTLFNCNKDGGQEVYHIHLHLLGGRALSWPPG